MQCLHVYTTACGVSACKTTIVESEMKDEAQSFFNVKVKGFLPLSSLSAKFIPSIITTISLPTAFIFSIIRSFSIETVKNNLLKVILQYL